MDYFQKLFQGENSDGLILRERWLAVDGLFDRLGERHHLAVFTGRLRWEANVTLNRFLPDRFDPVIGADDVARSSPIRKACTKSALLSRTENAGT